MQLRGFVDYYNMYTDAHTTYRGLILRCDTGIGSTVALTGESRESFVALAACVTATHPMTGTGQYGTSTIMDTRWTDMIITLTVPPLQDNTISQLDTWYIIAIRCMMH